MKTFKEINWGLHEVIRFRSKYGLNITRTYLDKILSDSLIYSNSCIISKMLMYDFITVEKENVSLTNRGEKMINSAIDRYELSDMQKNLSVKVYMEVNYDLAKQWFFLFSNEGKCTEREGISLSLQQFTEDMIQLGIARQIDDWLYINEKYYSLIKSFTRKDMTEAELFVILETEKRLGELAEEVALEYERKRLIRAGNRELAQKVQLISKTAVNAGYDLKSYKNADSKRYDAYIEVKYFNNNHFYLSNNESFTAEMLQESYYLYLVNTETKNIRIIDNPDKNLKGIATSIEVASIKYTL